MKGKNKYNELYEIAISGVSVIELQHSDMDELLNNLEELNFLNTYKKDLINEIVLPGTRTTIKRKKDGTT